MNEMIERYIHDVVKRLPEKDRADIERELRANIYDMLPPYFTDADVLRVLTELGDPAVLAEKYRTKPRYLISPAIYDNYINIIKLVLPIVGLVILALSAISESIELLKSGSFQILNLFTSVIPGSIGSAASGAMQAFIWITIGFAIAERCGEKPVNEKGSEWRPESLPPIVKKTNKTFPLSDCIAELVLTVIGGIIGVAYFSGSIFTKGFIIVDGNRISDVFSAEFSRAVIPVIIIVTLMGIIKHSLRLVFRKWNIVVCAVTVLTSIIGAVISVNLMMSNPLFSETFLELMSSLGLNELKNVPLFAHRGLNVVSDITVIIIIFSTLCEVISAFFNTFKPERQL